VLDEHAQVALQAPHPLDGIRSGRQVSWATVRGRAGYGRGLRIGWQERRTHCLKALSAAGLPILQQCPAATVRIPALVARRASRAEMR
jgi:hypothetical protein